MTPDFLRTILVSIVALVLLHVCESDASAQGKMFREAMRLENKGEFNKATQLLQKSLSQDSARISAEERTKILYQIERMRRIRVDYSLTKDELYAQLEHGVKNLSGKEFDRWLKEGSFDARIIDDTLWFVGTSRSNLFFRNLDVAPRRLPIPNVFFVLGKDAEHAFHQALYDNCIAIESESDIAGTPYVLSKNFRMKMSEIVDSGTVKPGETVKAWLPIPRNFPYQTDFELESSSSNPIIIAGPDSPIRSVFMVHPADSNGGAKFTIQYSYSTFGVHFGLDKKKIQPYSKTDSTYVKYTSEAPNIVFTPRIKKLSEKIVGGEMNPLTKAKKIYDWISHNVKYSFAREYSTLDNISDYCLTKEYGDCGQEAMLFITLCRYNGIPARWQSGWFTFPNAKDIHDWTEIYLLPYGWIPVDPFMGIASNRYMMDLSNGQRELIHDFYFGGLDQYRMSANSDNNQLLTPAKKYFRSDNVDFQRGELETDRSNIYFDRWGYSLDVQELKSGIGNR